MLLSVVGVPYLDIAVLKSDFFSVNGLSMGRIVIGGMETHSSFGFEKHIFSLEKVWNFFHLS